MSKLCRMFVQNSWGVGLNWGLENPKQEGSIPSPTTNLKSKTTMRNLLKSISISNVITFAVLTFILVTWSAVVFNIIATGGSTISF